MNPANRNRMLIAGACLAVIAAPPCLAATQRSFVASDGIDTNPCLLTQPCRSFSVALGQTNTGGEIVVLDSAGYGPVTIGKAVSIVAPPGVYAGISVLSGDGVVVNAGPSEDVVLRGITINAQGGSNGIVFNSGSTLYIESCTVRGFNRPSNANIRFAPAGASRLSLKDSFVRGGTAGVLVVNATTAAAVTIDNTRIEGNAIGFSAGTFSGALTLRNSVFVANLGHAVSLQTGAGQALDASLDNVMVSNNAGNGVDARGGAITLAMAGSTIVRNATGVYVQGGGSSATARLTGNLISRNATGIQTGANGSILTPLSNTIEANGVDGTTTGSYGQK
jgi:hypothetical protein